MTRKQVDEMWDDLRRYFDPRHIASGLNEAGLGGVVLQGREVFAEFDAKTGELYLLSLICQMPGHFSPEEFHILESLAKQEPTAAAAALVYQPDNNGLFFSRSYEVPVTQAQIVGDAVYLSETAEEWDSDVINRLLLKASK